MEPEKVERMVPLLVWSMVEKSAIESVEKKDEGMVAATA